MSVSSTRRSIASSRWRPAVLRSIVHGLVRRHRLAPRIVLMLGLVVIAWSVQGRLDAADRARSQWQPDGSGWMVSEPVGAGEVISPGAVTEAVVPVGLVPDGAVNTNPTGRRTTTALVPGELVIADRLSDSGSANAARTPEGWATVSVGSASGLFAPGDRVDLHDLLDGDRVVRAGVVVSVDEGDLAVAVERASVPLVVRSLGRGGVVAVLLGG